jgi:hypothetical protein
MAAERTQSVGGKGVRPRIGFARPVESLRTVTALNKLTTWETLANGAHVMAISLESPEAAGLRIGLWVSRLPESAVLRVYAQSDRDTTESVSGGAVLDAIERNRASGDTSENGHTYWFPSVEGTEATLEIELPPGVATDTVAVAIPQVSHLYFTPTQYDSERTQRRAASCNLDVSCYLNDWVDFSKSVALMDFVDNGATYLCSGTLLADYAGSTTPYFLSANHCIDSQTIASTLETTWFYRSSACNGRSTYPGSKRVQGGATLLYHNVGTDTSFMRLINTPPEGSIYAGWLPALPQRYASVVGIHHPTGDLQKISFGYVDDYGACSTDSSSSVYCESATAAEAKFIDVTWQQGITEEGSSGSPLWMQYEDGQYYLVGALYAGSSNCYSDGTDSYGRFDLAYNSALKQWLHAGANAEYSLTVSTTRGGTVSSAPSGISCGSDCVKVFASGSAINLTAIPDSGYSFLKWDGACSGSATSCTLTMSEARGVNAYFVRSLSKGVTLSAQSGGLNAQALYAIAVPANAANLDIRTSSGTGDVDMLVKRDAIPSDSDHDCASENPDTIETCLISSPEQGTYYILLKGFAAYSGVALSATYSTSLSAYSLTVSRSGPGRVVSSTGGTDCGTTCTETQVSGTRITLTAQPSAGAAFSGWSGACSGSATTCSLTLTSTAAAGASFTATLPSAPSDCLFDWAERTYPDWFAPAGTTSETLSGYYLRHYLGSQAYLGSANGELYYLGPLTNGAISDLGLLSHWLTTAGCD